MAGGQRVAKAAPDGYTFLIGNTGTHAYSQSLYKKPLYNAATDFPPVGLMTESPRTLVARKDLPVNNLQEFIAYLKANASKMQFGSAGVGSGTHLPCVLFNLAIGVNVTHIPYRGEGPVMQDLIGGRIDYMCATIQTGAAQAKDGNVKGIAVMAEKRVPIIPDLPTTGEQGLPGVEASVWNAFFLPKGTPDPIVRKLNKAMSDTLDDAAIRKRLEELGLEIVPPERRTPGIPHQVRAGGDRAMGEAGARGRHQRGLRSSTRTIANPETRQASGTCRRKVMVWPIFAAATAVLLASVGGAMAQDWPARPVNLVVPYAAGGPVDTIGADHGGAPERGVWASRSSSRTSAAPAA